jgi:hypothetical protein
MSVTVRFRLLLLFGASLTLGAYWLGETRQAARTQHQQADGVFLPLIQSSGQATATPQPTDTATPQATVRPTTQPTSPAPSDHPRLWFTSSDLPRLRSWAVATNSLYADGLALLAERAKQEMDEGRVPDQDCGNVSYEEYPTEMYAELFAFLALVENDATVRADYATRAHTLLMHIMNEAAKGPASEENYTCNGSLQYPPFRHPDFATADRDRIRYHGEAFPLAVDWIYPSLTAQDKATIRQVFLRWSQEVVERGYHHPEPVGVINDPVLLADQQQVRFSGNNYYAAHMRNLGMMALALDSSDDANQLLHTYLYTAVGAHLYIFDHLTQGDSRGGLLPEGLEYSPQTLGYATQFLLALHTAGASYPLTMTLSSNPFWDESLTAYLHSLSPATVAREEGGVNYQPAFYGDGQSYHLPDFVSAFAPIGLYDLSTGNSARLNTIRWLQSHTAPGGAEELTERVRNPNDFREAILYFLLYDPTAVPATDPRTNMATSYLAPGLNRLFSRSDWSIDAAWFTFALSWNSIDHQMADGNSFAFYRNGEWLTKGRVGYANIAEGIASSEFYNALVIHNDRPLDREESDWRIDLWRRGSQFNYVNDGDPQLLATSLQADYTYALGDATSLYNSTSEGARDVAIAERAIFWIKPDYLVIYDRAASKSTGKFKRWWLQLPAPAIISRQQATMTTTSGQRLLITTLLPADAVLTAINTDEPLIAETAAPDDPMRVRLRVDAPGNPQTVRFLHVLQGVEVGAGASPVALLQSADNHFQGARSESVVVLFPIDRQPLATSIQYTVPTSVTQHFITGLKPTTGYTVQRQNSGGHQQLQISEGGATQTDAGGVLAFQSK